MKCYINYSICICSISFSTRWSVLSWIYEDEWLYGVVSKNVNFKSNRAVLFYNIGLNLTAIMLIVRGIVQVLDLNVVSAVISDIAGIGHIILGISLMLILFDIKKSCIK